MTEAMRVLMRKFGSVLLGFGVVLFLLPVFTGDGLGSMALAQEGEKKPEQKTRKTPAMREKVYKRLSEAQTLAEADQMPESLRILQNVRDMKDLNSYETAQLWNFYGFIYFTQEDYAQALTAYENVLAQPDLPEATLTT